MEGEDELKNNTGDQGHFLEVRDKFYQKIHKILTQ